MVQMFLLLAVAHSLRAPPSFVTLRRLQLGPPLPTGVRDLTKRSARSMPKSLLTKRACAVHYARTVLTMAVMTMVGTTMGQYNPDPTSSPAPNDASQPPVMSDTEADRSIEADRAAIDDGSSPSFAGEVENGFNEYNNENPAAPALEGKFVGLIVGGVVLFVCSVGGGIAKYCRNKKRKQQTMLIHEAEERKNEVELEPGTIVETDTSLHAKI